MFSFLLTTEDLASELGFHPTAFLVHKTIGEIARFNGSKRRQILRFDSDCGLPERVESIGKKKEEKNDG